MRQDLYQGCVKSLELCGQHFGDLYSHAAKNKSSRQGPFQLGWHMQPPNDGEGQTEQDDIRDNVRECTPDVECLLVDALLALYFSRGPLRFEGCAGGQVGYETRNRIADQNSSREAENDEDASLREQFPVKYANGQLGQVDGDIVPC